MAEEINDLSQLLFPLYSEMLFEVKIESQLSIMSEKNH